ncbi:hypothetical protein GCM10010215_44280 [Streptomyces virginiae]|uniref:Uncharacterized protein n=1 Tax=Streptomyces virginiae TaxID=1961 RepID=A0ABQ3NWY4_STRVG|nr:hypothetical protein [Streptomyces virginiae]MBP2344371.1 pyruvoyl-dependent arginine decarboxylase (PvlArgDC) [Streptomyces virginiae]GGQ14552.1 hypothetical protein GCM10010215_44280 [Streptomyces virginiae]GHI17279.1 hypothetical protein Scinn_67420 [Streptomyces virginiae]
MLTYENVMNAPLDTLQTAITDWTATAGKLDEMAEAARNSMKAKSDKADWNGVTAAVARGFVDKTAKEFEDAAKAAKGMHQVLADAHATFKAARDELKRLAAEAPAAGFRIDATGRVSAIPLPTEAERNAARHDPDYQQTLHANRNAWQSRVDRAVENAQDADDSLVRALRANATDEHDFSGPKFTTLDAEQAARAADLMKKVTGPGGTARNVEALRELEELLDDNREDPEFSTGLFRTIGAEGTLQMYSAMSLDATSLGAAGKDRALMVANIQSDLGAMLGLATHKDVPGHLDAAWTAQLMKAGHKEMAVFGGVRQIYGYQALGALLREGKYDTEFLTSVGRDMIAMDRKDPGAWEFHTPIGLETVLNQGPEGGRGFYPLTGLMEALGNNPDAATAFFNEPVREDSNKDGIVTKDDKPVGGQHGKDRGMVDYMLDKKPYMDGFDITPTGDLRPAQQALGDALVAAVSHRGPGDEDAPPVAHTREMAAVMERIVEKIGDKPELVDAAPGDPEGPLNGLSGHFGQMAAEYMPDIQAAADNTGRMIKANGVMAEFNKADMAAFVGAVGQDPDAYGAITNAQRAFTTTLVNDVIAHRTEYEEIDAAITVAVHPGGQIAGILSEARAEGTFAQNGHKAEEYVKGVEDNAKWINRAISAAGGKYLEMVPLAGDVVEWLQEDITESVVERAKKDQASKVGDADHEAVLSYTQAQVEAGESAAQSVRKAAEGTGMNQRSIDALAGTASAQTANAHAVGRGQVVTSNGGS